MAIVEATIVSVFQQDYVHKIPGVYPGDYLIPAAKPNDFSVTRVPVSQFYVDSGEGTPKFPVIQDPSDVSKSIVFDIRRAFIESNDEAHPGMFAIDGWINKDPDKITPVDIAEYKKKIADLYSTELAQERKAQELWAKRLVTKADDDWAKFRSQRAISDLHRWAAKYLGLNREYTSLDKLTETVECPACGLNIKQGVAICFNCKAVLDPVAAKKFGLVN